MLPRRLVGGDETKGVHQTVEVSRRDEQPSSTEQSRQRALCRGDDRRAAARRLDGGQAESLTSGRQHERQGTCVHLTQLDIGYEIEPMDQRAGALSLDGAPDKGKISVIGVPGGWTDEHEMRNAGSQLPRERGMGAHQQIDIL